MSPWIAFTVFAALMQAVRTAGQKQLSSRVSPMSSTLIRYIFGWPFALGYLFFISYLMLDDSSFAAATKQAHGWVAAALTNQHFLVFASLASALQIIATALLIKVFSFRNFTVGTSFAKTEAIQAALFGTLLFSTPLNALGWVAVGVGFMGIFIVSIPNSEQRWEPMNIVLGSLSGTAFALTSLSLREASLSLNLPVLQSAAITLVCMVSLQSLLCLMYTLVREPAEFSIIRQKLPLSCFVGLTSALGSIGWFSAMTYENPALVKSLGQVEFIFTMLLTTLFFKESITKRELLGVAAIVLSVLLILRAA